MKTSFKIFNFVGAPVEITFWFFLLFFLLPSISMVVSVFIAVLIHEMAHAWVANKRGWRVSGIKIDLFTGSAQIDPNIHERDSIPVVAAGPISNLLLALIGFTSSFILISILGNSNVILNKFLTDFIVVNFFLFLFNMLPIFPMDGGRLVKDFLTLRLRSRLQAKKIAGWLSLITSATLLVYSILYFNLILILFSALFIYVALKEIEIIKD